MLNTEDISVQDGWQAASEANADLRLAGDELNPHFTYDDEDAHVRHQVWMLDAVTALNELRAARQMGLQTFALWLLGEEDPSVWSIWDHPSNMAAPQSLKQIPPGNDVVTDGEGDILRITGEPHAGSRTIDMDSYNWTVTDEHMLTYPSPYSIEYYGYKPGAVAISFDDGPDPTWTPKILDILKQKGVHATFMMIGEQAQDNVSVLKRVMAEGHEIGNHTWTHPDISEISPEQVRLQLNLTERLFGSKLGVKPLFFRPPYDIDEEPDTNDQAAPAYLNPEDGLHHRRQQDRYPRLGRARAEDAAKHSAGRARSIGADEEQAAIPRQHHPDARWRRQSRRDGGRTAGVDRRVAGARLYDRAGF